MRPSWLIAPLSVGGDSVRSPYVSRDTDATPTHRWRRPRPAADLQRLTARPPQVGEREDLRTVVDELAVEVEDQVPEGRGGVDLGRLAQAHGHDLLVREGRDAGTPGLHPAGQTGPGGLDLAVELDVGAPPLPPAEGPLPALGEGLGEVGDEPADGPGAGLVVPGRPLGDPLRGAH